MTQPPTIHPTVRKYIGKAPKGTPLTTPGQLQGSALQEGIQVKTEAPEGKSRTEEASERIGQMASKCKVSWNKRPDIRKILVISACRVTFYPVTFSPGKL